MFSLSSQEKTKHKAKIKINDCFSADIERAAKSEIDKILIGSIWEWEHYYDVNVDKQLYSE